MTPSHARPTESYLPLTSVVFEILVTLASGEHHGYSMLSSVRARTGQTLRPGSLYRAINRLVTEGFIEELDERPDPELDDERRRYYQLTQLGRAVAKAEASRLAGQVQSARAAKLLDRRRS